MKINKDYDLVGFKSKVNPQKCWSIHKAKFCSFDPNILYVLERSLTSQLLKELIPEHNLVYPLGYK